MKERWGMVGFPFYNTLSLSKKEHVKCSSQVATQLGMHRNRVQKRKPRSGTKTAKYAV